MKLSRLVALGLLLSVAIACAQSRPKAYTPKTPPPAAVAPAAAPPQGQEGAVGSMLEPGDALADTVLLASVNDRRITVQDYVWAYFASYAEHRPRPDSAGRIEFLASMVNKEILGVTALAAGREFGFEDRLTMRAFTQTVLSNAVYQHYVLDSAQVDESEIRALYETQQYDQHFRHILFADREVAARVAAELRARRITWAVAVKRYHATTVPSDMGWIEQATLAPELGVKIYGLPVGAISDPIAYRAGYHVFQSLERRARKITPPYDAMRSILRATLVGQKSAEHAERIQVAMRERIGMSYDTTAVRWVSTRFGANNFNVAPGLTGEIAVTIVDTLPAFTDADTGRVLARWRGGQMTLGPVLKAYSDIPPVSRPLMNTPDGVKAQVDALVLGPYMAEFAVDRGFDKDPSVVLRLQRKREEILVNHMFADSVESKIWISKADRLKHYKEHPLDATTYPTVRFAALTAPSRAGADSLAARLRGGESAVAILLADSLAGIQRGSIKSIMQPEHGPYHKLLFEELRPGQVSVEGPDAAGDYLVLQSLAFDPGHLLPFEEVSGMIDESLQNIRGEEALKALIARARQHMRLVEHPELLQRVRLEDPTLKEE